jgi:hypothetical protein
MTIIAIFYTPLIKWALRPRNNDSVAILRHVGGRGGCWLSIMHRHVIPRSESTEISSIYPRHVIGERWNLQIFGCVNFCLVNLYVGPKRGHKKKMRFTQLESLLWWSINRWRPTLQPNQPRRRQFKRSRTRCDHWFGSISRLRHLSQRLKIGLGCVNVAKNRSEKRLNTRSG